MKPSISILCHSALPQAKRCIQSVLANSEGHEYELILTANGNPEAAAYFKRLMFEYPDRVQVVVNEHNQGFIEPNKHALQLSRGTHLVMLNDDATVPVGWLDALEAPFLADPKCAATGPVGCVLDRNFCGHSCTTYPEYIEGSCLCVRVDVARKIGLFAIYLRFAYAEDADLCLRLREDGYTIHLANFRLDHAHGATSGTVPGIGKVVRANQVACLERWADYMASDDRMFPVERKRLCA